MTSFEALLVPVINSPASLKAVAYASELAGTGKGRVIATTVIEVDRSLPLDAEVDVQARRAEQTLRRAEEAANGGGSKVETELLQARDAGPAIVQAAREHEVNAIVMGIGYNRVVDGFQLGRTAEYILKHAPCEVWVIREASTRLD